MKNVKYLIILALIVLSAGLFSANATIGFKDATTTTYNYVLQEDPAYPVSTPTAYKWVIKAYLSSDNVVDPLLTTGEPSVNDVYLMDLRLGFNSSGFLSISSAVVPEATWMGADTWLYLRVFNNYTFGNATKYMTFFAPYKVTAGGGISVNIMPNYGWQTTPVWNWIAPPPADTWTYNLTVNGPATYTVTGPGTYTGAMGTMFTCGPNNTDINDLIGTWTPSAAPAGSHWEPATIEVVAGDFTGAKVAHIFNATKTFNLVADPDPYLYKLYVTGPDNKPVTGPTAALNGTTDYMVQSAVQADLLGSYMIGAPDPGYQWTNQTINVDATGWTLVTPPKGKGLRSNGAKVLMTYEKTIEFIQEIPPITEVVIDLNGNTPTPGVLVVDGGVIPPALLGPDAGVPAVIYTVTYTSTNNVRVYKPAQFPGDWYCWIQAGAMLYPAANPIPAATMSWLFTGINFDAKGPITIIINDEATLPVELSSFSAILTAQNFVKLTWVTESETNMNGYNVYRNETADYAAATHIGYQASTNSSTQHVYTHTDNEVETNNTYYYWLECVDFNGTSTLYGPQYVTVVGNDTPNLPTVTTLNNAYPNPFKSSTTIAVDVKEGENATVTIYNILGQAVMTYRVPAGTHNLNWNGRDSKGNACGSGIYFYKLTSPTKNQTKKMVIVK